MYPTPYTGSEKKLPAGILAILLGGFGIHKFYLGFTQAGLIMLLCSILTCGILYPVMHFIGIAEGVIYLTRSDPEFVNTYVYLKKDWF